MFHNLLHILHGKYFTQPNAIYEYIFQLIVAWATIILFNWLFQPDRELENGVFGQLRPLTDSLDGYLLITFPVDLFRVSNFENRTT